jgi:hypothetical protein
MSPRPSKPNYTKPLAHFERASNKETPLWMFLADSRRRLLRRRRGRQSAPI